MRASKKNIVIFLLTIGGGGFFCGLINAKQLLNSAGIGNIYQHKPAIDMRVAGVEKLVLSSNSIFCSEYDESGNRMDFPDSPVRAVRNNGNIVVVSAFYNNILYESSDLTSIARSNCRSVMPSSFDKDPSRFSDHEWLVSLYSENGNIFGLIHNEYWGALYNPLCRQRLGKNGSASDSVCLYGNLTGSTSLGNLKFKHSGVVAAYPYKFKMDMNRNGIRDPSNLFYNPKDGFVYFLSWVDAYGKQKGGECLFRSKDPFSESWFAWDGKNFGLEMKSPYNNLIDSPRVCEPINKLWITTVVYYPKARIFIALAYDERVKPGGIFYMTSPNLVDWSEPLLLMEAHGGKFWRPGTLSGPVEYPSLIDPSSSSHNFDTTGDHPYLYFIRRQVKDGKQQGRNRDIVRMPLVISISN